MTDLDLRARLARLYDRWPADDPIQIMSAGACDDGVRLEAVAECGGIFRRFTADLPLISFADEDAMVEAARAGLRASRNATLARLQAQVLEA